MQAIAESCDNYPTGCDYTSQFSSNAYAWNAHSHLLFVDNPRGVGYSYGVGPPANGTSMAAQDMVSFLLNFMPLYPELENNAFVISGESYFGHYGPAWAAAILKHNAAAKKGTTAAARGRRTINLRGIMIGNGWVDPALQNYESLSTFAKRSNLVPADWAAPARSSSSADDNDDDSSSTRGLHSTMVSYMGYTFNEYDIRQRLVNCPGCMGYNYTAWTLFFQRSDVKSALGVCLKASFPSFEVSAQGCLPTMIAGVTFDAGDRYDYKAAIATALEAGVEVLLYYGQQDTVCNFVGGEAVAAAIPWSGRAAFNALPYSPLVVAGATVGSVKQMGRLGFALVEGSGHMVPADEPATAAALLHAFLDRVRAGTGTGTGAGAGGGAGTGTGAGAGGGAGTDDSTDDNGNGNGDNGKTKAKNKRRSQRHSSSSSTREAPAPLPGEVAAWVFASLAVLMVACAVLQRRQRLAALNNGGGGGGGRGRREGEEQGVGESGGAIAVAVAVSSPLQIARRAGELEMGTRVQYPFGSGSGSGSGMVDAIPLPHGPNEISENTISL